MDLNVNGMFGGIKKVSDNKKKDDASVSSNDSAKVFTGNGAPIGDAFEHQGAKPSSKTNVGDLCDILNKLKEIMENLQAENAPDFFNEIENIIKQLQSDDIKRIFDMLESIMSNENLDDETKIQLFKMVVNFLQSAQGSDGAGRIAELLRLINEMSENGQDLSQLVRMMNAMTNEIEEIRNQAMGDVSRTIEDIRRMIADMLNDLQNMAEDETNKILQMIFALLHGDEMNAFLDEMLKNFEELSKQIQQILGSITPPPPYFDDKAKSKVKQLGRLMEAGGRQKPEQVYMKSDFGNLKARQRYIINKINDDTYQITDMSGRVVGQATPQEADEIRKHS